MISFSIFLIPSAALFFVFIAAIVRLAVWFADFGQSNDGLIDCDLCPQRINAKNGHHPKSIGTGFGNFHNIHLIRKNRGEPMIQGNFKKYQVNKGHRELVEKEKAKQFQLEHDLEFIMSQPIGEEFIKTLDIQKECDRISP